MKLQPFLTLGLLGTCLSLAACGDSGTKDAAVPATAPAPTMTTGETMAATGDAVKTEADSLIAQATAAIQGLKMEDADKAIAKLEEIKPKLPADYAAKIDQLKSMYTAAKAKMPAMTK